MKVLILTDSLALPRETPEICFYEDCWPQLLSQNGFITHQVSIGGATSSDLLRQCVYHKAFNPDILIIQVGIVDCSPRFVKKGEKLVIEKVPIIGKYILNFLNKPYIRKVRKISYITENQFIRNLESIVKHFENSTPIFIGIVNPSIEYEKTLPNISNQVKKYNDKLKSYPFYVELDNMGEGCIMSDFHHLSAKGHKFVFQKIVDCVVKIRHA